MEIPSKIVEKVRNKLHCVLPDTVLPYRATLLKWAVIGYLIRVTLIPLMAHGDLFTLTWTAVILKDFHKLVQTDFPILITIVFAVLFSPLKTIIPFEVIFGDIISNTGYTPDTLYTLFRASQPQIFTFLFVSKIPYLAFDYALSFLLLRLLDSGEEAVFAFKMWMVNPVTIYVSYAFGHFDIIPTFFLIAALYFCKRHKVKWAMTFMGLCAIFKFFGLLFIPALILIFLKRNNRIWTKVKNLTRMITFSLWPLLVVIGIQFIIPSYHEAINQVLIIPGDYRATLQNPQIGGLIIYGVSSSASLKTLSWFVDIIYLFPLIYGLFLVSIIYQKSWSFEGTWKIILAFLLGYYAISLFHVQWFLWVQPLLLMLVAQDRRFLKLYLSLVLLYFIYIWYWNAPPTVALLVPITYRAFFWPGPVEILNNLGLPALEVISVFRSILSAVCLFIAIVVCFNLLRRKTKKQLA